jgi:hypothetical protein
LTALCKKDFTTDSNTRDDMVSKVEVKYFDRQLEQSLMLTSFQPKGIISENASWGINSFIVVTGLCHQSCFTCNYDSSATGCLTCTNLLAQAANKSCSLCIDGFYYESDLACSRCPITCLRCVNTSGLIECSACAGTLVLLNGTC